jgi:hypothetical protein
MHEIDDTGEAGVFDEIAWIDPQNPRNRFILGATLLQDIGDESEGSEPVERRWWHQISRAVDFNLGGGTPMTTTTTSE